MGARIIIPPMPIPIDLRHVARLARLELPPEEAARLEADCRRILEMAASIQGLKTDGVEPLTHAMEFIQPLRADEPGKSLPREEVQKGAPAAGGGFFLVPKMKD